MKEIKLTQDKIALVDDEDFEYLNQFKWYAGKSINTFYACRRLGKTEIRMHREIMKTQLENNIGKLIDHKDGNGLNNQKNNLRTCTISENNKNRHTINNSSGYLGVSLSKRRKKWLAQIKNNKKVIYLGYFKDKKDAAKAYNEAAIKYHGEFASPNIIDYDENKIN